MTEWRDISSAPTDGTKVLVGRFVEKDSFKRNGFMAVDFWHEPKRDKCRYSGWGEFNKQFWPPTHWQPLPEPPEATWLT